MGSYYWIKMYHEVLHDPKMGRLSDHLWRRFFELCLIAGETDREGCLPPVGDMAWTLRTTAGDLDADLHLLAENELVHLNGDAWIGTKFADRQSPLSAAERKARQRERDKQREYYGHETSREPVTQPVTNRDTDIDTDTDTDIEKIQTTSEEERDSDDAADVLREYGMDQVDQVLQETRLEPWQIVETVAYAKEQSLGPGWVRGQLRQGNAYRPRAPDDGRKRYVSGRYADIIEH